MNKFAQIVSLTRGTDKVLMLCQYTLRLVASFNKSQRLLNLAGPIGETRMLLRYPQLILVLKDWIREMIKTKEINVLSIAMNLANVFYYPLEHVYYLGAHQVLDIDPKLRDSIGTWSVRFWAIYVGLYFVQLYKDKNSLDIKRAMIKSRSLDKNRDCAAKEMTEFKKEYRQFVLNALVNVSYFPLTLHWSFPEIGLLNDLAVSVCGIAAAAGQLVSLVDELN